MKTSCKERSQKEEKVAMQAFQEVEIRHRIKQRGRERR